MVTSMTSDLTSSITAAPYGHTDSEPCLPVFKVFTLDAIDQGTETVLTFTIDNSANSIEATGLTFTDPLTSGVVIAASPGSQHRRDPSTHRTQARSASPAAWPPPQGNLGQLQACCVLDNVTSTSSLTLVASHRHSDDQRRATR